MIIKLEEMKGKRKLKFYQKLSNYYDEMNYGRQKNYFQFEDDPFGKDARGISKYYHEVLLIMKFQQTKPLVKNEIISYYDSYYTVIKNRDDKEIVNTKYEDNEVDYVILNDFFVAIHYVARNINIEKLK